MTKILVAPRLLLFGLYKSWVVAVVVVSGVQPEETLIAVPKLEWYSSKRKQATSLAAFSKLPVSAALAARARLIAYHDPCVYMDTYICLRKQTPLSVLFFLSGGFLLAIGAWIRRELVVLQFQGQLFEVNAPICGNEYIIFWWMLNLHRNWEQF